MRTLFEGQAYRRVPGPTDVHVPLPLRAANLVD
jgi:hypothetical protein